MVDVVVVAIVPVIGHRVSDGRAANAADDRAHRAADRGADGGAADRSTHRAAFVGKGELSRGADEQRRCESENSLGHLGLLKFGRQWRRQCRPTINVGASLKFLGAAGRPPRVEAKDLILIEIPARALQATMRKLLRKYAVAPERLVTDDLWSYPRAMCKL